MVDQKKKTQVVMVTSHDPLPLLPTTWLPPCLFHLANLTAGLGCRLPQSVPTAFFLSIPIIPTSVSNFQADWAGMPLHPTSIRPNNVFQSLTLQSCTHGDQIPLHIPLPIPL